MREFLPASDVYAQLLRDAAYLYVNQVGAFKAAGMPLEGLQEIELLKSTLHGFAMATLDFHEMKGKDIPAVRVEPSRDLRNRVFERDDFKCLRCGNQENLHADHVLPVAHGGETTMENLQTLCSSCNLSKGTDAVRYAS